MYSIPRLCCDACARRCTRYWKGKRTSGNSCQHSEFSWNLKYSRKSRTLSRAQSCTLAPYPSRAHGEPVTKTSLPLKIPFTAKFCSSRKLLYPIYLAAFPIACLLPSFSYALRARSLWWAVTYRTPHDNSDVVLPESWQCRCGMLTWVTRRSFSLPASSAHKEHLARETTFVRAFNVPAHWQ